MGFNFREVPGLMQRKSSKQPALARVRVTGSRHSLELRVFFSGKHQDEDTRVSNPEVIITLSIYKMYMTSE